MRPERANAGGTIAQDEANPVDTRAGYNTAPAVLIRIRQPLGVGGVDPKQFSRPVPDELGRPAVGPDIVQWERPWDKEAADYFTGEHALIKRPIRNVPGVTEGVGLPSPIVFRPTPLPWYCGTTITPQTPPPTPHIVDDSSPAFVIPPADIRSRLGL